MNERDLFLSALEIEDLEARKAHLQSACAGNGELLSRVESLLASHEGESEFLKTPVLEQLGDDPPGQMAATIIVGTGSTQGETPGEGASAASVLEFSREQEKAKMADEVSLGYLELSTKPGSLGRLAHYEILEVVGQGAFGTVLRAFDEKLQRVVAIKVMAPELAATSPARKRFLREAQASAAIRHENVVSVYAVEEKPIPYLVMEYIPGITLQQRLQEKGPLDIPTVLRLGIQIAEGLDAAHAKDLIHRDIKPGNIMLETGVKDRVKITDFGLARAADDASMTQSGTIAGTPMYMAPEQALGHKLDQRADLFSFGSVLYQMVSGRPPFRAPSTLAVLKRLTEDTPRPIKEIIPETPTWMCDIIAKLHAKDPNERYQTAREIADVLADCEAQLKSHSGLKNYSLIPRAKAQPAAGWWKWVAVAAVVLPLLAIVLYALTRPGSERKIAKNGTSEPQTSDPIKPGEGSTPASPAKQETLPSTTVSTAPTLRHFASDEWIDVIPLIDPRLDKHGNKLTGRNEWRVDNGELVVGYADEKPNKLLLPLDSDWQAFECEFELTRRTGENAFNLNFPVKQSDVPLVVDLTGRRVTLGRRAVIGEIDPIQNGERTKISMRGRKQDGTDHLEVAINGKSVGTWTGNRSTIEGISGEGYAHDRRLSLWIPGGSEYVFHQIRVRMLDGGTAETLRPVKPNLLPPTFKNSIGMEFVIVPQGKSWLGGGKDKLGDKEVEIPADFYLGKYEVTQEEWEKVMGENPSAYSPTGIRMDAVKDIKDADLKRFPVENVSWDQCQTFVAKLNELEKETGWVYRLPKELEWEYACRGGPMADKADSAFDFYFAKPTNTLLQEQANFDYGLNRTCLVGSYEPNRLGLFDMHGNVTEYCDDAVKADDGALNRVVRGGNWTTNSVICQATFRFVGSPSGGNEIVGLRLARVPSGAHAPEAKTPPVAVVPLTDADVRRIAALTATEQVEEVRKALKARNPDFDGMLTPTFDGDAVVGLKFSTERVMDVSPVRALTKLTNLEAAGPEDGRGLLTDLSVLKGLPLNVLVVSHNNISDLAPLRGMPINYLMLNRNPIKDYSPLQDLPLRTLLMDRVPLDSLKPLAGLKLEQLDCVGLPITDLSPLKGMPLKILMLASADVADLAPLTGMKLEYLNLHGTKVSDLSPLKGMPLMVLHIRESQVTDLSPLKDIPLKKLFVDFLPTRDAAILREIKTLEMINDQPAAEYLKGFAVAPFTDADAERIAALPAAEQVEEYRKEMKKRNPEFDGTLNPTVENDVVTKLEFFTNNVEDISPIRVFSRLTDLNCRSDGAIPGRLADLRPLKGMQFNRLTLSVNPVSDITPLKGMPLTDLHIDNSHVSDLSPLIGLQLKVLNCSYTKVSSLKPLQGMSLVNLWCNNTEVDDLTPVKGMSLEWITIQGTKVQDLSPLKGMPLTQIYLDFDLKRDGDILRSLTTLQKINDKPADEFWKENVRK